MRDLGPARTFLVSSGRSTAVSRVYTCRGREGILLARLFKGGTLGI